MQWRWNRLDGYKMQFRHGGGSEWVGINKCLCVYVHVYEELQKWDYV